MKPVDKGTNTTTYSDYKKAKPKLLERLGEHCSYCERSADPQDLHVEHIYPKDPHPELQLNWDNFLLACNTCNSYKNIYQGNARQTDLERRFVWPHRENTFRAFAYKKTGEVEIAPTVLPHLVSAVDATREMVGLLKSPAVAAGYEKLGIAYDGTKKRSQVWGQAMDFLDIFESAPTRARAITIADGAAKIGYFSVWMEVFKDFKMMREELIRSFKADPDCFDSSNTEAIQKGRL